MTDIAPRIGAVPDATAASSARRYYALALLTIATFPTGRWLGLDALVARVFGCRGCDTTPTVGNS